MPLRVLAPTFRPSGSGALLLCFSRLWNRIAPTGGSMHLGSTAPGASRPFFSLVVIGRLGLDWSGRRGGGRGERVGSWSADRVRPDVFRHIVKSRLGLRTARRTCTGANLSFLFRTTASGKNMAPASHHDLHRGPRPRLFSGANYGFGLAAFSAIHQDLAATLLHLLVGDALYRSAIANWRYSQP